MKEETLNYEYYNNQDNGVGHLKVDKQYVSCQQMGVYVKYVWWIYKAIKALCNSFY